MAKMLLLEDVHQFIPSAQSLRNIVESSAKGTLKYPVEIDGRLSVIGIRNENNRRYTEQVWAKQLKEDSQLRQLIKARRSVGLLEHPGDGTVSLNSPISHVLMDVRMEGNEIFGKIGFINTAEGNKMLALIEAGYNPLVSSRGYGSVVKAADGVDEVQEDYVCEGWDVVWNPSFKTAEMDGNKLRLGTAESKTESVKTLNEKITSDSPEANVYESVSKTADTYTNMSDKFKSIRESLAPIATVDVAKMAPQRIVETLSRCGELHRQAASVGATDANLSWDVQQVHTEISSVEARLTEAMAAPQKRIEAMNEQSIKTLKTLKVVAETALKYKASAAKFLGESKAKSEKLKETVERGHGWVKRAKIAEAKLEKLDAKYQYACETVDEIQERYKSDTTALGRRLLQLEFADKFTDEALAKSLNEAASLKDLIAIRATCEGKIEEFKEPDGKELKVSGGKAGPGEVKGKETPTKSPTQAPKKGETLDDTKDDANEEQDKVKKDGAGKGGSNKGTSKGGKEESVSKLVKETVGSKAGPGEVDGKETSTKSPTQAPNKDETLDDTKDDKDEEESGVDKKGAKKGGDDKGTTKGGKEESTPGVRDDVLVESTPLGVDRLFDVTELAGSIKRLSESRK